MRPNMLLITTDQHRWDWLGCHGTPGVQTPHLDALAARGTRITGHVTNAAICAPARIGLATGVRPLALGALGNSDVLDPAVPTYYQALRDAGYRVGCVGKLDLDKPDIYHGRDGDRPKAFRWGFTHPVEVEGKMQAGGLFGGRPLGPYGFWLEQRGSWEAFSADYDERLSELWAHHLPNGLRDETLTDALYRDSVLPTEAFQDVFIGQRSCRWLEGVPDDFPWHLYVSFVGPHDPFDPPTEYADRFRDAAVPMPVLDDETRRSARVDVDRSALPPNAMVTARRQYTASLAVIDDQIGEILTTLERRGMAGHTLVVFSSDHGEMLGDHGLFQKHYAYEPAMRIPMLAAGPGVSVGVSAALTELVDVTATILDFAGTEIPGIDGRSMRPIFEDPSARIRDAVSCSETPYRAIRTDRWKFIHNIGSAHDPHELYDLVADPDETHNLIDDEPSTAADLLDHLTTIVGAHHMPLD